MDKVNHSKVEIKVVIKCNCLPEKQQECIGFRGGRYGCMYLLDHKCLNTSLVAIPLKKSPYQRIPETLEERRRDFDMVHALFQWELEGKCPDLPSRNEVSLLLKEATDRSKVLTEFSVEPEQKLWK